MLLQQGTSALPPHRAAPTLSVAQRHANHAGGRYEGEVSVESGRREGRGTYFYPNPYFTYEGDWLAGKKHGSGRLTFEDGGYYEGEFRQGEIVGEGVQLWANGTEYTGQFLNGLRHGSGVLTKADGTTYDGAFGQNQYAGAGSLVLPTGDTYRGEFAAHKYHGSGALAQPSADRRYIGGFAEGAFEGEGELHERGNEFVYAGQWRAGVREGRGKQVDHRIGLSFEGEWAGGLPAAVPSSWDLAAAGTSESYLPACSALKEEAADQLLDAKEKKAKEAAAAKKAKEAGAPAPAEAPSGPELLLQPGASLPQVVLRMADSDGAPLSGEAGRCFRVTMYREQRKEGAAEVEIERVPVRFADQRQVLDPAPGGKPGAGGKVTPVPKADAVKRKVSKSAKDATPVPTPDPDEPPPHPGDDCREGALGPDGRALLGGGEEWLVPAHLQPAIYSESQKDSSKQ
ncbi:unnamed protein product [Prorocentrum cordatum]|uniref:MORN repeat-containing protein 5 n=1 Tax=Prorocentrum cordatum TaxID=2364126 RepID=A0ABN9UCG2_9DINO|nr:unnamed protein product [Polarella glacialis]